MLSFSIANGTIREIVKEDTEKRNSMEEIRIIIITEDDDTFLSLLKFNSIRNLPKNLSSQTLKNVLWRFDKYSACY